MSVSFASQSVSPALLSRPSCASFAPGLGPAGGGGGGGEGEGSFTIKRKARMSMPNVLDPGSRNAASESFKRQMAADREPGGGGGNVFGMARKGLNKAATVIADGPDALEGLFD